MMRKNCNRAEIYPRQSNAITEAINQKPNNGSQKLIKKSRILFFLPQIFFLKLFIFFLLSFET